MQVAGVKTEDYASRRLHQNRLFSLDSPKAAQFPLIQL